MFAKSVNTDVNYKLSMRGRLQSFLCAFNDISYVQVFDKCFYISCAVLTWHLTCKGTCSF